MKIQGTLQPKSITMVRGKFLFVYLLTVILVNNGCNVDSQKHTIGDNNILTYEELICREFDDQKIHLNINEHYCLFFNLSETPCLEEIKDTTIKYIRITSVSLDIIKITSVYNNQKCWLRSQILSSPTNYSFATYLYMKNNHLEYTYSAKAVDRPLFYRLMSEISEMKNNVSQTKSVDYREWWVEILYKGTYEYLVFTDLDLLDYEDKYYEFFNFQQ